MIVLSLRRLRFLTSVQPGFLQNWRSLIGRRSSADEGPEGLGATSANPTVIYDVRGRVVAKISSETVPSASPSLIVVLHHAQPQIQLNETIGTYLIMSLRFLIFSFPDSLHRCR